MKLYVGNLSYTMSETALGALFASHGVVQKVHLIRDHFTRHSKCFGYVQMEDSTEGKSARRALHGKKIDDRFLVVKEARPREERFGQPW